jgi:DNA-binding HxlR family transcriptional regulator
MSPDSDRAGVRRAARAGADRMLCPVYASIQLLQEKWALHIVRALLQRGTLGFNELRRAVGCNPATLTQRLDHLETFGLVSRTVHSLMPPRTSYALTTAGAALDPVVGALADWAASHLPEQALLSLGCTGPQRSARRLPSTRTARLATARARRPHAEA